MKYIEELVAYQEDIDATQIAEILWLSSQLMVGKSSEVEEKLEEIPTPDVKEPKEREEIPPTDVEEHESIDEFAPSTYEDKKEQYGFEKEQSSGSIYATNIIKKEKFPEIEKQFQSLKVKQNHLSNKALDELKTADYIATTGYFHPIFAEVKSKKSYFSLHIIIDKSESMFLWESYAQHFIKSIKFSSIFTHIRIFELESSQKEPSVSAMGSDYSMSLDSAMFREERSITLVFSDITGDAWKSNRMFEVLEKWSKGSFVTIVSMLPKRMWKKTPLRQGVSLFMKPRKFLPKNRDLKAEFDFMATKKSEKSINIPMLTFDSYAFSHLSNVLMSKKESWIDTRTFKNLVEKEVSKSNKKYISPKERVKNFFSFALPKTRELAVYCSVLPLNNEIIREVIKARDLGTEKDVFSEFYFGGLIEKDAKVTFGEYAFYEGVAKELRQYISVQEMEILLRQVSKVMSSSFGINMKKLNLLYESTDEGEVLNDNERALAELMIEVLKDKGKFYEGEVERLINILDEYNDINKDLLEIIKWADIYNISIEQVPRDKNELFLLNTLKLQSNDIDKLPNEIGRLLNLEVLDIGFNKIKELPESIGNLKNLKEFYMRNNEIKELPESLGNLTNLIKLYIGMNKIEKLPNSMKNLKNLIELEMANNQLNELFDSIGNLQKLKNLWILDNNIKKIPSSITTLSFLSQNSRNQIKNLRLKNPLKESFFEDYSEIILWIEKNNLYDIPKSNENLKKLISLDISNTQIKELPNSIGNLKNLISLNIANTQIKELPNSIGNLRNLTSLNITNTQIKELPNSIGNLSRLYINNKDKKGLKESYFIDYSEIRLWANKYDISKRILPRDSESLMKLDSLDISNYGIKELPSSIGSLINLSYLNVSNNKLTSLPSSIDSLINLSYLNVSNNKLMSLSSSFDNLENLVELDISFNQISSFYYWYKKLKILRITGNPLCGSSFLGDSLELSVIYTHKNQLINKKEYYKNCDDYDEYLPEYQYVEKIKEEFFGRVFFNFFKKLF